MLRHFPIIPRLKRIFATKATAESTQWHKKQRRQVDNEMSHPADGKAWKHFDRKYPSFAAEAWNLRLAIATDGFNPFGKISTTYSMWPVLVKPLSLPPWECVDESNCFMSLLIPGPTSPGKDFDLFLEPLIEELLELWGVSKHWMQVAERSSSFELWYYGAYMITLLWAHCLGGRQKDIMHAFIVTKIHSHGH